MKKRNYLPKKSLLFGLILSGCVSTSPAKEKKPVFVVPVIVENNGKNFVCYSPEDHEKLMLNFLE